MAAVTITNLTAAPLLIQDLYTTIPASSSITVSRAIAELSAMPTLQAAITSGAAGVSIVLTAAETGSGLTTSVPVALAVASDSVQAADIAPVSSTTEVAGEIEIRKSFAAGAGGAPDDVTIYAVNTLPYKMRILDAYAIISTAVALSTLQVRSAAAGGGILCAEMPGTPTGRQGQTSTVTASQVLTPGALVGLFVYRSDSGIAGEVVIEARRET